MEQMTLEQRVRSLPTPRLWEQEEWVQHILKCEVCLRARLGVEMDKLTREERIEVKALRAWLIFADNIEIKNPRLNVETARALVAVLDRLAPEP